MEQFSQTMVLQAPAGFPRPMWWCWCRRWWIGMPCCGPASLMMALGLGAGGARAGSVDALGCLHIVEVLSDEALIEARSRLDPAAG
ncbi:hypothetical protein I553_9091 [Mycobacterium xenopi 4042]|uniref:Uncharacterized protein n=1 Tax=Mycobacterium xenopi 4042 TaxID=1299334 RepID=X8AMQ2_MYCXE|nr:hypothetical protein I553_9091 [Mycobacterium xenopi 4042]